VRKINMAANSGEEWEREDLSPQEPWLREALDQWAEETAEDIEVSPDFQARVMEAKYRCKNKFISFSREAEYWRRM
jgi:hypothetical protein